jgi:D-alanyl-D-alanine carboxypeptidase (penicillin-binding protein 5/6)
LADADSGALLFETDGDERRPIASLTKIMTALVVISKATLTDVVEVSDEAAAQEGASLGLRPGERIPVGDLLYALMLQSSNDAAVALAEHVAGSVDGFVGLMNDRAASLGLEGTRFASPTGLDDSGYSTAEDLATITRLALRRPAFARIVSTKFYEIPSPEGEPRVVQNRNALLWLYQGAMGVKTGFTSAAGHSVVAAAEREGLRLAGVILGATREPFSEAATLLNYGFAAFERRRLVVRGERFEVVVQGLRVPVSAVRGLELVLHRTAEVERRVEPNPGVRLPLEQGSELGRLIVQSDEVTVARVPLVAERGVAGAPVLPDSWLRDAWEAIVRVIAAILGLFS